MHIKLKSLLKENVIDFTPFSDINHKLWYHGRIIDNDIFSLDYVGGKEAFDQEGPGFYFTNNLANAQRYAEHKGIVLMCKISYNKSRLLTPSNRSSRTIIETLIDKSPNKEEALTNFGEYPRQARVIAINTYKNYGNGLDAYTTIANDFYRGIRGQYLKNLSHFYDGHMVQHTDGIMHFIVYNPNNIKVIGKMRM